MGSARRSTTPPPTYLERLREELGQLRVEYQAVLDRSGIRNVDPNRAGSGIVFLGAARWGWTPSDDDLERQRMALLAKLRPWGVRFRLLFTDPTPTVMKRINDGLDLLERWLVRSGRDQSLPGTLGSASDKVAEAVEDLDRLLDLVPADAYPVRLLVDTNSLIDDPDLARYVPMLGPSYLVHVIPVVLGEIDNLKRAGRTPELREHANRANRRLKGLRDNGDVSVGARVSGEVYAIFDFREPVRDGLPSWLDLSVPDDRLIAAALRLQSDHPGSALFVATSDLNLQTKLAAVGLPFIEMST
jgi:rRNA-processing protein FCF1